MGARTKINAVAAYGSLALAAIIGGICGSWTVFFLTAGVLLVRCMQTGAIRIKGQHFVQRRG